MPNILDHAALITCVSRPITNVNTYTPVVIIPTPTITYNATRTMVEISSV